MTNIQLPPLQTPQTARIRASYPVIEYLEEGYVADWLKERRDQLLELAREERSGVNANKLISGAVLTAGFFFHALSPLAPIGAALGVIGYIHGCFIDANQTGNFSPLPFVRGNVLDLAGTLGNADLRQQVNGDVDEFEQLQHYLPIGERKEYQFIENHFVVLTNYLTQVEPLKRFHAFRWIFDCFTKYQALPSPEQVRSHMANVVADLRVDSDRLDALEERRLFLEEKNKKSIRNINQMNEYAVMPEQQPKLLKPDTFDLSDLSSQSNSQTAIIDASANFSSEVATTEPTFEKKIPSLVTDLATNLKRLLIYGVPGSGKDFFMANLNDEIKKVHGDRATIFMMDCKADPKEAGYFKGKVNKWYKKRVESADPEEVYEWAKEVLAEYDAFDAGTDFKILEVNELAGVNSKLKACPKQKGEQAPLDWWISKLEGYATSGDSYGCKLVFASQNGHGDSIKMSGGVKSIFCPILIAKGSTMAETELILKANIIPSDKKISSNQMVELCKKSPVDRCIYHGGFNEWFPVPEMTNHSGYNRDKQQFLGDSPKPNSSEQIYQIDIILEKLEKSSAATLAQFVHEDLEVETSMVERMVKKLVQDLEKKNRPDLLSKLILRGDAAYTRLKEWASQLGKQATPKEVKHKWLLLVGQDLSDGGVEMLMKRLYEA